MPRPGGLVLLVALVAIVAGCTAADRSPDLTVSPAPVPDETRAIGGDLAPGVTDAGIRWPYVLVRSHVRTLEDTSFTVTSRRVVDGTDPDGRRATVMRGRFAIDKSRYHQVFIQRGGLNGTPIRSELYADGDQLFEAIGTGADRRFYRPRSSLRTPPRSASFFGNPTQDDRIYIGVKAFRTRLVSETKADGERRYRLVGSRLRLPDLLAVGTIGTGVDRVANATLAVTVGTDGVIYEYRLRYAAFRGNETVRVNHTVEFSDVGSTNVIAPDWYPLARQAVGEQGNATSL